MRPKEEDEENARYSGYELGIGKHNAARRAKQPCDMCGDPDATAIRKGDHYQTVTRIWLCKPCEKELE